MLYEVITLEADRIRHQLVGADGPVHPHATGPQLVVGITRWQKGTFFATYLMTSFWASSVITSYSIHYTKLYEEVESVVLKDRFHLSNDGLVIVVLALAQATGEIVYGPDIVTRGVVSENASDTIMEDARNNFV